MGLLEKDDKSLEKEAFILQLLHRFSSSVPSGIGFAALLVPRCSQTAGAFLGSFLPVVICPPARPLLVPLSNARYVFSYVAPLVALRSFALSQAQYSIRHGAQVEFASQTSMISSLKFQLIYRDLGQNLLIVVIYLYDYSMCYILSSLVNSFITVIQALYGMIMDITGHLSKMLSFNMLNRLAWILDKLGKMHLFYNKHYGLN